MIDIDLNTRLNSGEPKAYEELYALMNPRLKNYCKLFFKDLVLIEDLVQNAFVKLWEKRETIDPAKSVESLLFTITRNQCLNYLRDQKLNGESLSIDEKPWSDLQHLYQLDFEGHEGQKLEEQLLKALKEAIEELPKRQHEILVKCKIEGKKQKEVAQELGITIKAVEKSLSLSKRQLQTKLMAEFAELAILIAFFLE